MIREGREDKQIDTWIHEVEERKVSRKECGKIGMMKRKIECRG